MNMEFDLVSFLAGIGSTIIGSVIVALFILWIQTRKNRNRTLKALFAEIRQNNKLLKHLMGEGSAIPHWSLRKLPISEACFDNARQSGFLYSLKPPLYQEITRAYTIIHLINREGWHPQGTARAAFEELGKILASIIKKLPS